MTAENPPVCDAAHINQQVAVVSQQPLLHLVEVDSLVIEIQQAHAALEGRERVLTGNTAVLAGTT